MEYIYIGIGILIAIGMYFAPFILELIVLTFVGTLTIIVSILKAIFGTKE